MNCFTGDEFPPAFKRRRCSKDPLDAAQEENKPPPGMISSLRCRNILCLEMTLSCSALSLSHVQSASHLLECLSHAGDTPPLHLSPHLSAPTFVCRHVNIKDADNQQRHSKRPDFGSFGGRTLKLLCILHKDVELLDCDYRQPTEHEGQQRHCVQERLQQTS